MNSSSKDIVVGGLIVAIGAAFLYLAYDLAAGSSDPFGPALAPEWIAVATIVLGAAQAITAFIKRHEGTDASEDMSSLTAGGFFKAAFVIGVGVVHMVLFTYVGFLIASVATLFLLLALFADWRNPKWLLIAVLGGIAFHLVFIELMSIYDPNAVLRLSDLGLN